MTDIRKFFAGKGLFVTGVSGYLGRAILEKLLRSCPDIGMINVLIRHKRGMDTESRLKCLFQSPIFEVLKSQNSTALTKVRAITGDITLPDLGISEEDRDHLVGTVSVVIHSAATVRFTEPIKDAININVYGTERVLNLAKRMPHLVSFVYVSTAYANCDIKDVKEEITVPVAVMTTKEIDNLSDKMAKTATPIIIGNKPNTYTYTKSLAENLLQTQGSSLPIAIVRPSIIGPSWKEPEVGYVDSFGGATGAIAIVCKGFFNFVLSDPTKIADFIPLDVTCNMIIAVAFDTATRKPTNIPVYNCCTGSINPVTWGQFFHNNVQASREFLSKDALHYPRAFFTRHATVFHTYNFIWTFLPSLVIDGVALVKGEEGKMVKSYKKVLSLAQHCKHFTLNEWNFETKNMLELQKRLGSEDKEIFFTNVEDLDWHEYSRNYVYGIKKWLLKEDLDNLEKNQENMEVK